MGMRWTYNLTVHSDKSQEIIDDFRKSFREAEWALDADGSSKEETAWNSEEDDMEAISLKYPDVLFEMYRDGTCNSSDDLAYIYYKNGKKQVCYAEIKFPPFDESKLE